MSDDLSDLYQEVILDHSRRPRNFHVLDHPDRVAEGHNPLCGDQVKVYLQLEGDLISDVSFQGAGCAISKASASMMTTALKGKTKAEAECLFGRFHEMIKTGEADIDEMGKLAAFSGVHKFPTRVKCAILSWHAVMAALEGTAEKISTE